jgi:hypothetical protein
MDYHFFMQIPDRDPMVMDRQYMNAKMLQSRMDFLWGVEMNG